MPAKISVIIPALNEERTIASVVSECLRAKAVREVIVVDDRSTDRTSAFASAAGARVITSHIRGKGKSMEDGLEAARGDILVYVDADIKNFSSDMVNRITDPILSGKCDFVKSRYGRKSGRVTELVAKPLLNLLFPSLVSFSQPLSGIIAGRAHFFRKAQFENDYGVDIGILIDMVNLGARIMEVDIGYLSHKMKPWRKLVGMSSEVAASILKRVRITNLTLQEGILAEVSLIERMLIRGAEVAFPIQKAAFLDVDGTILRDRFIFSFAKEKLFEGPLKKVSSSFSESYAKTRAIASFMQGYTRDEILSFSERMKLSKNVKLLIGNLRKNNYFTILMSDGYDTVVRSVANRIGADAIIANHLGYANDVCTGDVEINPLFFPAGPSCVHHAICKLTAAMRFCKIREVPLERTFAIGNGSNDSCLLRFANVSYAYMPDNSEVASSAKYIIKNMAEVDMF